MEGSIELLKHETYEEQAADLIASIQQALKNHPRMQESQREWKTSYDTQVKKEQGLKHRHTLNAFSAVILEANESVELLKRHRMDSSQIEASIQRIHNGFFVDHANHVIVAGGFVE